MITAELRSVTMFDGSDLNDFHPEDRTHFEAQVDASMGIPGIPGEDRFTFTICSPSYVAEHTRGLGGWFGRLLILASWDPETIKQMISDVCDGIQGATWEDIAWRLSRYSEWEFEFAIGNR